MFKLIEKKEEIGLYSLIKQKILADTKDGLLFGNRIIFKPKKGYINTFKIFNDNVYLFINKVGLVYFNIDNYHDVKEKDFIKGIGFFINENDIIYSFYSDDYSTQYRCRINLATNKKLWTIESYFGNGKVYNNFFYASCTSNRICKIDLNQPKYPLWQFDVSLFGTFTKDFGEVHAIEVNQLIDIWNKQLIILLNNGEFISLDIENGKLLWQKKQVDSNFTKQNITYGFGLPYHPFLDKEKGIIHILQSQNYIEYNLNTQKASYLWNSKDISGKNNSLFIKQTRLYNGNIYFTASKFPNLGYINVIGVFNIEKREIIWSHILDFEKGVFINNTQDSIQVNEKNLFVLDSKGTLHIFQKQETTT